MISYFLRRLILIIPTLFGIILLNFLIIQFAPGGPVESTIARLQGIDVGATERVSGGMKDGLDNQNNFMSSNNKYVGAQGLDPSIIAEIEKMYGFDQPPHIRFYKMIKNYLVFDFGESFFQDRKVIDIVIEKLPVSISLGLWTTLLIYLISIPLGVYKAVNDGRKFDVWSSVVVIIGNAVPSFLFAILLIILFAGGRYLDIFPLRGIISENWGELNSFEKILDYIWHITLPIFSLVIGGFASLTMLTKNSFLDQINQQYVLTARSKGNTENKILYGHIFRNAMLIIIAGFPTAFISILFTGALLTEIIFSLDGLGLLGFEAAINRDYPVMFATLYVFTLLGLFMNIIGDLAMTLVDPRIDFEKR
ncbi:MAG TPA: microcin C ABC transporter permease YejB [Alphaproteobacteria bacterium]|jgi:microcin C transport system permease protein|nr:microcin C ABC transporter permease YejB [Alphaproteobacteria bacterium]|tara:strand:+ start:2051 stop:3142 length:1092 start_codon:yes stop_codon:yes gene_type:complete